jgi:hypothetical protein
MVFTRDPLYVKKTREMFGMSVRFERDMSKGEFVRLCETLEKYAGTEHYRFEPLPERPGIKWVRYARKVPAKNVPVSSGKEFRFLDRNRQASVPWPSCASRYTWTGVEDEVAVNAGVYQIEMLAYGNAPRWMDWQVLAYLFSACFSCWAERDMLAGRADEGGPGIARGQGSQGHASAWAAVFPLHDYGCWGTRRKRSGG